MTMEWQQYNLGDLCVFKYGKMPAKADLCEEGYPVFSGYNVVGYANTYHYEDPEIVVVARGVGGTGDVKMSPPKCFLTNLSIAATVSSSIVNKKFLYYRLAGPKLWELRTGSAQAQITIDRLKRYELHLPPFSIQSKIASILSAYDDLIENNIRRIQILEEMAQRIYKEWFVDFRFPDHEKVKFVDSELGRIPSGWEVKSIMETFSILGGGTPSKTINEYWEGGEVNWYTPSDLTKSGNTFMDESNSKITAHGLKKSSATLFPAHCVMMTSRATLGVLSINTTEACTNQGFITCRPNGDFPLYFMYHWLRANVELFIGKASGTTFKEITKGVFKEIHILVPRSSLANAFEGLINPLMENVLCLQRKNTNLRQTRDLLLPKLISGEIDVSDMPDPKEAAAA